jgi:hypothetical protein
LEDFLVHVNNYRPEVQVPSEEFKMQMHHRDNAGSNFDSTRERKTLTELGSPLVLNEVIAVRLYTGPYYSPINTFLHELGKVGDGYRRKIACNPRLTYAATVGWICSALRKLAKITGSSALFRGMKGELPAHFFEPDAQGLVCVTEYGMMSTSTSEDVCKDYMEGSTNVMWQLSVDNNGAG